MFGSSYLPKPTGKVGLRRRKFGAKVNGYRIAGHKAVVAITKRCYTRHCIGQYPQGIIILLGHIVSAYIANRDSIDTLADR